MVNVLVIGWLAAGLASEPGLDTEWLYHPVGRSVIIEVEAPETAAALSLVLMNHEGNLHTEPVEVTPGPIDLARAMPDIWRLRRAAYLQLLAGEEPIGTSLVLQPMLSRLVPQVEEAVNPNGIHYTRIVGWRDETASDPAPPEGAEVEVDEPDEGGGGDLEPPEDPWLANQDPGDRLATGLRIYPERDVVLHTSAGSIRIALRPDEAPNTAWNFLQLCRGGFYRDIAFHRVVPLTRNGEPFVIQAGDPTRTGSGGPGYWLPIEPSRLAHDFGVISMARDVDPDSAGSQFFICLSRAGTARLDGHYCAFGMAVEGGETIHAIAGVELADVAAGRPVAPPVIDAAEPVPAPPRRPGLGRPEPPLVPAPPPAAAPRPERVPR
jgi:peptidyl-prolyl cis-trans isomerase B (cyclophilin B)